jgi:peptidoglycan hydrolase CwlO-like protein
MQQHFDNAGNWENQASSAPNAALRTYYRNMATAERIAGDACKLLTVQPAQNAVNNDQQAVQQAQSNVDSATQQVNQANAKVQDCQARLDRIVTGG